MARTPDHPRVLLGLAEISGYYARVGAGLRELGVPCDVITLDAHRFAYDGAEAVPGLVRVIRRVRAVAETGHRLVRPVARVLELVLRAVLLVQCLFRYDVFVFGFRTTFLKLADLPVLRLARKRMIFVFHGSDSRPPVIDGFIDPYQPGPALAAADERQHKRVRWIERWADELVVQPLAAQYHQRPIVLYQAIGHPAPATGRAAEAAGATGADRAGQVGSEEPFVVVHAPSNPVAKGTERVRAAIAELRAEGRTIDYVELTGRTNAEVLAELGRAHAAVDQAFSDISLSVFAAEAAGAAVPPVVGGYGHEDLRAILAPAPMAPGAYCHPDAIAQALRDLADDPDARRALGAECQEYIAEEWTNRAVAARLLEVIESRVPDKWRFDPAQLTYVHGAGIDEDRLVGQVRSVLDAGGPAALQLDDRPVLRERLMDLAGRRGTGADGGS